MIHSLQTHTTINTFPAFTKFSPKIRDEYNQWFVGYKPYSDFTFNNLMNWVNINDDLEISRFKDSIVYRYTNPFGQSERAYSILGNSNLDEAVEAIFKEQIMNNEVPRLTMIPQETVENLSHELFHIEEDRDNFDYIFSCEEWYSLPTSAKHARRRIRHLITENVDDLLIKQLDLSMPENRLLIVNAMHQWDAFSALTNNDKLGLEGVAINNCLTNIESASEHCIIVMIKGRIVGILLYQYPPQAQYVIINHIKCDYTVKDIFDFVVHCAISKLYPQGIKYFNGEQDLGIPGLRIHKQLMHPVDFLKRYTITSN